jgi:hypothetical protein
MLHRPPPPPRPRSTVPLPDAVELMVRLMELVSVAIAHHETHPECYQSPTGRLLAAAIDIEAKRIFRRAEGDGRPPGPPPESTV